MSMDADVLARTIWGEARGDGPIGMYAVACVVLNRVANPRWWGHSITTVCLKPWQFSAWNATDPNRAKLVAVDASDPMFAQALRIAEHAVEHGLPDVTLGADSYHTAAVRPPWSAELSPTTVIAHHLFYRTAT